MQLAARSCSGFQGQHEPQTGYDVMDHEPFVLASEDEAEIEDHLETGQRVQFSEAISGTEPPVKTSNAKSPPSLAKAHTL